MLTKYPLAILEVLVLQRFPYGKDSTFFYYAAGENLRAQVGDVVKAPWHRGEKQGVVVKTERIMVDREPQGSFKMPNKPITLKPVSAILARQYFTPELLEKLKIAARQYFVSWNHFAKSVVDLPTAKVRKNIPLGPSYLPLIKEYQRIYSRKVEQEKLTFGDTRSFVFVSHNQPAFLKASVRKALAEGKQVLVLVPEKIHLIPTAGKYAALAGKFGGSTPILLGKFLPRAFARNAWEQTRQGEPHIFVGTRSAIFAPFANLGLIVVEEGQDPSHKQWDLAPLYDLRNLTNIFYPGTFKIYLSDTPRLEDFYDSPFYFAPGVHQVGIKKLPFGAIEKQKPKDLPADDEESPHLLTRIIGAGETKRQITLISTKVEKSLAQEEAVISEYLEKRLIACLNKGKSALLLINHSGIANLIVCRDCGYVFRCPQCGKALSQISKACLDCRFCGFKGENFDFCPHCSGVRIIFRRYGIEKIKETLLGLQKKVNFTLLETPSSQAGYTGLLNYARKVVQRKSPLALLGFNGIVSIGRAIKSELGLAAVLDFDETLFYPDFRSEERTASRFYNLLAVAPKIYIQTADPKQPFLRKIINHPYSALFSSWLRERRDYSFPPLVNIMRIDLPRAELAERIVSQLRGKKEILETLSVPVSGATRKNKYAAAVVVKYPRGADIYPTINNLFHRFGNLRVDPDPEEL